MEQLLLKFMDQMNTQFDKVHHRLDRLDEKMDKLENRMDKLENRMDTLELSMDKLENRMDKLETRMDRMETRTESLESGQKQHRGETAYQYEMLQGSIGNVTIELRSGFKQLSKVTAENRDVLELVQKRIS
ncbi:coiled-coil domain-containing protein [Peribacillus frigoritolerans]|uniref:coiled-coil domain-containing protein n=1 Tax=Peribacillus frigoritolerans TaxID=450367 RepID=UPI001059CC28|nr:hypothetical protein [Peribacillus frigoritolerans]TDL79018.1 hypothetical protein E2R53_16390 [Peribacillus frigoritolerans]